MSIKGSALGAVKSAFRAGTLRRLYPDRYRKACRNIRVDVRRVVFLEVRMDHLTDSFLPVYEALRRQGGWDIRICLLQEGMERRLQVMKNCLRAIEEIAGAGTVFVNDSSYFLGSLPLRPETKVIQLWHACGAFKKFGYSAAEKKFGVGKTELDRYPLYRNFSYVTVSAPEVIWAYAQAFAMEDHKERIVPVGVARTDRFYDPEEIGAAKERLRALWPELFDGEGNCGKKLILYAPTFRGSVGNAVSPDQLDLALLQRMVGDEAVILLKHHPFVKHPPEIPEALRSFARDVSREMEIEALLMISDVCISDYSSLIFEFSLYERPMIFFAFDLETYGDWRGFYYSYEEMTPGPVARTTQEVGDCLLKLREGFDPSAVAAFRRRFMSACDGHATERILALMRKR